MNKYGKWPGIQLKPHLSTVGLPLGAAVLEPGLACDVYKMHGEKCTVKLGYEKFKANGSGQDGRKTGERSLTD